VSNTDDRLKFEEEKESNCKRMGDDAHIMADSIDLMVKLDPYAYSYLWSWLGVPIIQMPADVMATQEVIWATKPDIIIESGVARGGSVLFMASILEVIGHGKVIGVDIDIRSHNRESIESHPMSKRVTLIEGDACADETMEKVLKEIPDGASVMVVLDSDHSYQHVLAELKRYAPLVTNGQFLVVADTLLGLLNEDNTPKKRTRVLFEGDEPLTATAEYLGETDRFIVDPVINGKLVLSSSPGGYLRCVAD
jgi:cephalosporin hydroxylase